jgi:hypothetical protein
MSFQGLSRRTFVQFAGAAGITAATRAASATTSPNAAPATSREPVANGKALSPNAFLLLPLGAIRPTGWLRRQLEVQAQGLSGQLDETWPDVGPNSGWHLRVPEGEEPVFTVNGQAITPSITKGFARIEREWRDNDVLRVTFVMKPRFVEGAMGTVAVMRGPLVFSLPIQEQWTKIRDRGLTADWQIFGESPWNYGITSESKLAVTESPIGVVPFAKVTPAVTISAEGVRLPHWHAADGTADVPPADAAKNTGESTALTLVPYASTKLRITSFPQAKVKA